MKLLAIAAAALLLMTPATARPGDSDVLVTAPAPHLAMMSWVITWNEYLRELERRRASKKKPRRR